MKRILMIAALVVVGLFVLSTVLGFVWGALKWLLIIGLIGAAVMAVMKITRASSAGSDRFSG
jgi:Zn-dependent protease with chaperone function